MIVAIDGPAGAGKSTVARALARRLGFAYLDTGAMYRCVALAAIERFGANGLRERLAGPDPGAALGALAAGLRIELAGGAGTVGEGTVGEGAVGEVLLDGREVGELIRSREVSEAASAVAAVPEVREALVAMQRQLVAARDWVAEGRDVGTVVAPHAELKVFLVADPVERARRRAVELGADPKTVLAEQAIRDARDEGRDHGPLTAAPDAVELDTTGMSVSEVVEAIVSLVGERA